MTFLCASPLVILFFDSFAFSHFSVLLFCLFCIIVYNFCWTFSFVSSPLIVIICGLVCVMPRDPHPHRDLPQDLCPVYRPGEWEQLPSERDLNPFSRYEALGPNRPILLDDLETGEVTSSNSDLLSKILLQVVVTQGPLVYVKTFLKTTVPNC